MISEQMQQLVKGSSVIRAMFEEGKIMAKNTEQKMYMISAWEIRV